MQLYVFLTACLFALFSVAASSRQFEKRALAKDPFRNDPFDPDLTDANRRAQERLPDTISLVPNPSIKWRNEANFKLWSNDFASLGFRPAGSFTVEPLQGLVLSFLINSEQNLQVVLCEHEKGIRWIEIISRYENGTTLTYSSMPDKGFDHDPRYEVVHLPDATPKQLYQRAITDRPMVGLKPHTEGSIVSQYEQAYADLIKWAKTHSDGTHAH